MIEFHDKISEQNLFLVLLGLGRLATATLLGEEDSVDVGEHTALGNGHPGQQFVQLLVIANGELKVPGNDPGLLVVPGSVPGELQDLSSEVLHHGGQIDRGASTNPLGVVTLAEKPVDTTHGKLETSAVGPGLGLHLGLATFTTAGHCGDRSVFSLVEVNQAIL